MNDLERWNARYLAKPGPARPEPPPALVEVAHLLPSSGAAVDLAGGSGAGARFLAGHGLTPVVVDISDVALRLASAAVPGLATVQYDLAGADLVSVLAAIRADEVVAKAVAVVCCFYYLDRHLLASVARGLPAGALFVAAIATTVNLERNRRPSARFLLEPGELAALVVNPSLPGTPLEIVHSSAGWNRVGRHEAVLVVRGTGGDPPARAENSTQYRR